MQVDRVVLLGLCVQLCSSTSYIFRALEPLVIARSVFLVNLQLPEVICKKN